MTTPYSYLQRMAVSQQAFGHVALFLMLEEVYEEMSEDGIFLADFVAFIRSQEKSTCTYLSLNPSG